MGSRERLWALYGDLWGWPPATMTYEEDRADLARHAAEMPVNESFNYAVFDAGETELLGCIYIDPPGEGSPAGSDAFVSWWVVDDAVGYRARGGAGRVRAGMAGADVGVSRRALVPVSRAAVSRPAVSGAARPVRGARRRRPCPG